MSWDVDIRCFFRSKEKHTYCFDIMAIAYGPMKSVIVGRAVSNTRTGKTHLTTISDMEEYRADILKMVSSAVDDFEHHQMFE